MKRNWVILFALGGSLAVHAMLVTVPTVLHWRLFAVDLPEDAWRHEDQITIVLEPPEAPKKKDRPQVEWPDRMGESKGTGTAANRAKGERPLEAREAEQTQGFLSRDPVGQGRIHADPSQYTGPTGDGGTGGGSVSAMTFSTPAPAVAPPVNPRAIVMQPPRVDAKPAGGIAEKLPAPEANVGPLVAAPVLPEISPPATQPSKPAAPSPPRTAVASARPTAARARPAKTPGDGRKVGLNRPSADPAQESDSESDPFMKHHGSVVVRDGKVEVQFGRKVKTTVPRLGIAGQIALAELEDPTLVFEISIEPSGAVSAVEFVHKSGRITLDEPCKEAIYNWWFEPAKDKSGKPVADVVLFTILWH